MDKHAAVCFFKMYCIFIAVAAVCISPLFVGMRVRELYENEAFPAILNSAPVLLAILGVIGAAVGVGTTQAALWTYTRILATWDAAEERRAR